MANFKSVKSLKYVTGKGEFTGFISIVNPSTKFDKSGLYQIAILLPEEEGLKICEALKAMRTDQFKQYGKGTKVADITRCVPYTTVDEETGEEVPDPQGRYILKATAKAGIKDGVAQRKIIIRDSACNVLKNVSVNKGTIGRLCCEFVAYSIAGKTGVSVKLKSVQIIELVSFDGTDDGDDFDAVEDGFTGTEENFKEAPVKLDSTPVAEETEEEEDF